MVGYPALYSITPIWSCDFILLHLFYQVSTMFLNMEARFFFVVLLCHSRHGSPCPAKNRFFFFGREGGGAGGGGKRKIEK